MTFSLLISRAHLVDNATESVAHSGAPSYRIVLVNWKKSLQTKDGARVRRKYRWHAKRKLVCQRMWQPMTHGYIASGNHRAQHYLIEKIYKCWTRLITCERETPRHDNKCSPEIAVHRDQYFICHDIDSGNWFENGRAPNFTLFLSGAPRCLSRSLSRSWQKARSKCPALFTRVHVLPSQMHVEPIRAVEPTYARA